MILWYRGDEVIRVTARKNTWGEVIEFICNTCRFERKKTSDWILEGPTKIKRSSVISANKYRADLIKKPDFAMRLAATEYKDIDDAREFITDKKTISEQSVENNANNN